MKVTSRAGAPYADAAASTSEPGPVQPPVGRQNGTTFGAGTAAEAAARQALAAAVAARNSRQ